MRFDITDITIDLLNNADIKHGWMIIQYHQTSTCRSTYVWLCGMKVSHLWHV